MIREENRAYTRTIFSSANSSRVKLTALFNLNGEAAIPLKRPSFLTPRGIFKHGVPLTNEAPQILGSFIGIFEPTLMQGLKGVGKNREAEKRLDELFRKSRPQLKEGSLRSDDPLKELLLRSRVLQNNGNYQEAELLSREAFNQFVANFNFADLPSAIKSKRFSVILEASKDAIYTSLMNRNYPETLKIFNWIYKLIDHIGRAKLPDHAKPTDANYICIQDALGQTEEATRLADHSIEYCIRNKFFNSAVCLLNNRAIILSRHGRNNEALYDFQQALDMIGSLTRTDLIDEIVKPNYYRLRNQTSLGQEAVFTR